MKASEYSESEARALQGRELRAITKNSLIPPGSRGRVVGMHQSSEGAFQLVVNWEVNPAFIMQAPIQATYSKNEASTSFQIVE